MIPVLLLQLVFTPLEAPCREKGALSLKEGAVTLSQVLRARRWKPAALATRLCPLQHPLSMTNQPRERDTPSLGNTGLIRLLRSLFHLC